MLQLPKIRRNPQDTAGLCKCRPVCHKRRREWKGQLQKTSDELRLERKPPTPCQRRWPMKLYPNSPCPLLGRSPRGEVLTKLRGSHLPVEVVRLCQAPLDITTDTTYLELADVAKTIGAWQSVPPGCAFCHCGRCCGCARAAYATRDAHGAARRKTDMRAFDSRLKTDLVPMKIMYDKTL